MPKLFLLLAFFPSFGFSQGPTDYRSSDPNGPCGSQNAGHLWSLASMTEWYCSGTPGQWTRVVGPRNLPNGYVGLDGSGNVALTLTATGFSKLPPNIAPVFEGDSITSGLGLSKSADNSTPCKTSVADATCLDWPSQLLLMSSLTGKTTKNNFAVAGNNIAQIQARYTASVHPLSPAVTGVPAILFVLAGSNNIAGASASAIQTGLTTYWAGAKADGFTLVAFTILRRGDANGKTIGGDTARLIANSWIRSQDGTLYDYLVDLDRILTSPWDSNIFQTDAIHPAAAGHYLIARAVNSILLTDGTTPVTQQDSVVGTGTENIRFSPFAMYSLTTGIQNTSGGWRACEGTTTGQKNTCLGYLAGATATTASNNTSIGWGALFTATGSDNVAIGNGAAVSGAGHSQNVVIGSLAANNASAGGTGNVIIGYSTGQLVSTNGNVVIGYTSGAADAMAGNGIAIGNAARVTGAGGVQFGTGLNSRANSLQFQTITLADNNGVTYLKTFTVATLPACGSTVLQGGMAFVTDATAPTYNLALTGGSTVVVPVFCDGTIWRSH